MVLTHPAVLNAFSTGELWTCFLKSLDRKEYLDYGEVLVQASLAVPTFGGYHLLLTSLGAQLASDVPFSAICWTVLEPIRRHFTGLLGDKSNSAVILGANFSAGFIAGIIFTGSTCPLDVAKTHRQIEKDPKG